MESSPEFSSGRLSRRHRGVRGELELRRELRVEGQLGDPFPHQVLRGAREQVLRAVAARQPEHVRTLRVVPCRLAGSLQPVHQVRYPIPIPTTPYTNIQSHPSKLNPHTLPLSWYYFKSKDFSTHIEYGDWWSSGLRVGEVQLVPEEAEQLTAQHRVVGPPGPHRGSLASASSLLFPLQISCNKTILHSFHFIHMCNRAISFFTGHIPSISTGGRSAASPRL